MKTRTIDIKQRITVMLLLAVWVWIAGSMLAGSYGWNTDPADDPRILEAYGSILGYKDANGSPRPATQREVSAAAMNWVNNSTSDYERRKNMAHFSPSPFVTSPTPSPSPSPTAGGLQAQPAAKKK